MTDPDVTPRLENFLRDYKEDDNEWWRISCGHHLNLFDQAMDRIEDARELIAQMRNGYGVHRTHGVDCHTYHADCLLVKLDEILAGEARR